MQIINKLIMYQYKKKEETFILNNDEINDVGLKPQALVPLTDTSYIKPGPVSNFQTWRDSFGTRQTTVPINVPIRMYVCIYIGNASNTYVCVYIHRECVLCSTRQWEKTLLSRLLKTLAGIACKEFIRR